MVARWLLLLASLPLAQTVGLGARVQLPGDLGEGAPVLSASPLAWARLGQYIEVRASADWLQLKLDSGASLERLAYGAEIVGHYGLLSIAAEWRRKTLLRDSEDGDEAWNEQCVLLGSETLLGTARLEGQVGWALALSKPDVQKYGHSTDAQGFVVRLNLLFPVF